MNVKNNPSFGMAFKIKHEYMSKKEIETATKLLKELNNPFTRCELLKSKGEEHLFITPKGHLAKSLAKSVYIIVIKNKWFVPFFKGLDVFDQTGYVAYGLEKLNKAEQLKCLKKTIKDTVKKHNSKYFPKRNT